MSSLVRPGFNSVQYGCCVPLLSRKKCSQNFQFSVEVQPYWLLKNPRWYCKDAAPHFETPRTGDRLIFLDPGAAGAAEWRT
jgi:hypothetical protein